MPHELDPAIKGSCNWTDTRVDTKVYIMFRLGSQKPTRKIDSDWFGIYKFGPLFFYDCNSFEGCFCGLISPNARLFGMAPGGAVLPAGGIWPYLYSPVRLRGLCGQPFSKSRGFWSMKNEFGWMRNVMNSICTFQRLRSKWVEYIIYTMYMCLHLIWCKYLLLRRI